MNVTHKQVRHHQFGAGTVTGQTMTTVTVEFGEKHGIKKFLYPSAFESFLELCDPDTKAKMDDELRQVLEQAEKERQKREEEHEKRREEERHALLAQKRAAAKKRSPVKKTPAKPKKQPDDM